MMSTRRSQYHLIKTCAKWNRGFHPTSFRTCKISQTQNGTNRGLMSYQVRFLSSTDDLKRQPEDTVNDAADKEAKKIEDQERDSKWNVFKAIQQEIGPTTSSIPSFKHANKEETMFLNREMLALSSDWPELAHMLDGKHRSLEALVTFIEENIGTASFAVLCRLMSPYLKVFKKETKQFKMVLDEGMRRLSSVSLIESVCFVQELNKLPEGEVDNKYYEICQEKLKARFLEAVTPVQLVYAMSMFRNNNMPELYNILDSATNEKLSQMSTENVVDLFHIQAVDKRRNPKLLNNIVSTLNNCDFRSLTLVQLANIFFSCASLSVYNKELLKKTATHTVAELSKKRARGMYQRQRQQHSILYSCSLLRWRDQDLLNHLNVLLEENAHLIHMQQYVKDIICLCNLGHKNIYNINQLFIEKDKSTMTTLKYNNQYLWLKYIHALAARRMASPEDIKAVLDPSYYSSLLSGETKDYIAYSTKGMLLNLQGCLEVDFNITDSPLVEAESWIGQMEVRKGKNSIVNAVETALKHISSEIKGTSRDKYGHRLDFEVMFRVPSDTSSPYSRVPVGIRVVDFNEMVVGSDNTITASGQTSMALRHLKASSMPVLLLPYYKWKSNDISLQNAISLENMLNKTVSEKMNKEVSEKMNKELDTDNSESDSSVTTSEENL